MLVTGTVSAEDVPLMGISRYSPDERVVLRVLVQGTCMSER
jgi:hypothetical protein